MKKFLSLLLTAILVMAMATVVFAEEVDLGRAGNGAIDLTNYSDGTIKVVVKRTGSDKAGQDLTGWGIGGLCIMETWSVSTSYEAKLDADVAQDGTAEFTFDVAAAKADLGKMPNVNFYNDFEVLSVTYISGGAAPTGDATPITALVVVALASCAAMVVLRKREA
jgi:hypothetical protein